MKKLTLGLMLLSQAAAFATTPALTSAPTAQKVESDESSSVMNKLKNSPVKVRLDTETNAGSVFAKSARTLNTEVYPAVYYTYSPATQVYLYPHFTFYRDSKVNESYSGTLNQIVLRWDQDYLAKEDAFQFKSSLRYYRNFGPMRYITNGSTDGYAQLRLYPNYSFTPEIKLENEFRYSLFNKIELPKQSGKANSFYFFGKSRPYYAFNDDFSAGVEFYYEAMHVKSYRSDNNTESSTTNRVYDFKVSPGFEYKMLSKTVSFGSDLAIYKTGELTPEKNGQEFHLSPFISYSPVSNFSSKLTLEFATRAVSIKDSLMAKLELGFLAF